MPTQGKYKPVPNADRVLEKVAAPQLSITARAIARAIPDKVPVHTGAAKRSYRVGVLPQTQVAGHPVVQVAVVSYLWHWLEYGTRWNPPYRPIQRAVEGLGLRYRPQ
jgi:hypothetical protein